MPVRKEKINKILSKFERLIFLEQFANPDAPAGN